MTRYLIEYGNVFSLASISTEGDCTHSPRPGINLNPPPQDARCECCRRHVRELPPFGHAGDPLAGDSEGERLFKTWRTMEPTDAEAEGIFHTFFARCVTKEDHQHALARLVQAYGEERAKAIYYGVQLAETYEAVWLCRDCIVLDEEVFWAKRAAHSPD